MKTFTALFIINWIIVFNFGQNITDSRKDTTTPLYYFVSLDISNAVKSFFTNHQSNKLSIQISSQSLKPLNTAMEVGYQDGIYKNLGWKMNGKGMYYKVGVNYFFIRDYENKFNGIYVGSKLGYSRFNQEIIEYPIRFDNKVLKYEHLPAELANSSWIEFNLGARITFYKKLFLMSECQPKILLFNKSQDSIESLFIPGVGTNKNLVNFEWILGMGYQF